MKKTVILAAIALVGLLGCSDSDKTGQTSSSQTMTEKTTQAPSTTGTPAAGPSAMSEIDRALAKRVEDALHQNSAVASAAQNVQVEAKNGEVTLTGSVNNEQEKANITSMAEKVAGVSKVNNEMEVASASSR
ncbi:MAG TPA: BON domain-containing protein [Candidatus Binatia bacterium]|jgi:osmotically-inducible protein OsmY|nr:BON domain-containing protein [Candidatus Binatia bacterium]